MLKIKSLILFLLSLMFYWSISLADTRGIRKVEIKTEAGETVGLYSESHALVIGVSNYTNGWPKLPGVIGDVSAVSDALETHGFKVQVVENPANYNALDDAFTSFISKYGRKPDNRLLFYFSGHGHTVNNYGEEMGYIIPTVSPNPNHDLNGFLDTAMDMQQIEVYAKRIRSKHALFIFDSCFSGSLFALSRAIPENISYKTAKPVRQFITSGSAEEKVPDTSIFRRQFVAALKGEGDTDGDRYITGMELGEFLQKSVINYSKDNQHPQYGKIRNPNLDKGDFVFLLTPAATSSSNKKITGTKKQGKLFLRRENGKLEWFEDGDKNNKHMEYIGEIENGLPNGNGEYVNLTNGDKFTGEFKQGLPIYGTGFSSDGSKYVGQLASGLKHGQGSLTFQNGLTYVGLFNYGKFDGHGIMTFPDGAKYVGKFKNDNQNGQGIQTYPDGGVHEGEFKDGKANGHGTRTFPDGEKHEGEFKNGLMNGQGSIILASGSTYVGMIKDDRKHGRGTYTWNDGKKYVGEYNFNLRHGWGTYTWPNGNKYVGEYVDGVRHGSGTFFKSNGDKYVGKFKNGRFHGQGKYTFTDGGKFVGEFISDKPWNVTEYLKDGTITGKYLNGKWK